MAEFKQQDKLEIYFTPQQKIRLKQAAFQSTLDKKKRGRYEGGSVSAIVRNAVDKYFSSETGTTIVEGHVSHKNCWAIYETMRCLKTNFNNIENHNKKVDLMDDLNDLMLDSDCWKIPAVQRDGEHFEIRKLLHLKKKGRVKSEGEKQKIGAASSARPHTEAVLAMREARLGKPNPAAIKAMTLARLGKHPSEDSRKKMREAHLGYKHTDEAKEHMRKPHAILRVKKIEKFENQEPDDTKRLQDLAKLLKEEDEAFYGK